MAKEADTPAGGADNPYRQELYKTLLAESQGYLGKMAGLWLQKLVLVGGVMVFLYGHRDDPEQWEKWMRKGGPWQNTLALATLALPLLALLLDLKHLEYAVQARAISRFIRKTFQDVPAVRDWEVYNWGDREAADERFLAWLRTLTSAAVAALPTLALTYFSLAVIGWQFDGRREAILVGVAVTLLALIGSWRTWRLLWPGGFHPLWPDGWGRLLGVSGHAAASPDKDPGVVAQTQEAGLQGRSVTPGPAVPDEEAR
jgi:hypothetical protein